MGLPRTKPLITVDRYLALERKAKDRHEYLDGQILAMAGESDDHGIVSVNVVISLGSQLRGKPCQVRTKDAKVRSGPIPKPNQTTAGLYSYPDVLVVCGEPEYHDHHKDVLLNPTAIFEVMSESTEAFDRGKKFTRLETWNPTLQDYFLIAQDQPQIQHFCRQADGSWTFRTYSGLKAKIKIPSIGCTLALADVYERIEFSKEK
jgi:Uma2 family endonuclease